MPPQQAQHQQHPAPRLMAAYVRLNATFQEQQVDEQRQRGGGYRGGAADTKIQPEPQRAGRGGAARNSAGPETPSAAQCPSTCH